MPNHVLLACMPKSGSSFLSSAIAALPDFNLAVLTPYWGGREQEIEDPCLVEAAKIGNYVAQHHTRYSGHTRAMMDKHSLSVVVLVRNIFDVVPSFVDHHRNASIEHPLAFVPEGSGDWPFEKAARFVTSMMIPWYFNFYASWYAVPDKILVKYEDWIAQPDKVLSGICKRINIDVSGQDVSDAIAATINTTPRKNTVGPGRGATLPADCVDHIRTMAKFYERIDFSPIGL